MYGGAPAKVDNVAPVVPGAPVDPATAVANAKEKLGELSDIKRDLNAVITTFENMKDKVKRFIEFKTTIDNVKETPTTTEEQNEIIGAYNYMKEEGVALKEDFKKIIDSQKKSLKTLQNKILKILQSEPQSPIILNMIQKLVTTMEEKSGSIKTSRGIYNDISSFYTNFENDFNDAFSRSKTKASAIQEQRKQDAEARARAPIGYYDDSHYRRENYDLKRELAKHKEDKKGGTPPTKETGQESSSSDTETDKVTEPTQAEPPKPKETPSSDDKNNVENVIKGVESVLTDIVLELMKMYTRRINPTMSVFTSDSLFNRILNDYLSNRNETNEAEMRDRFMSQLETNNLIPSKVLEVTQLDKIIFIFVTLFLRILCGSIVVSLIERGIIKSMTWAVAGYLILYTLILVAFVSIVNLDMYRMRIVFNYVNFHANAGKVYMHVLLLYILGILIYIIMSRINLPVRNVTPKAISDNEKLRLIMRFQILTGILWVVLAIAIVLSSD
jgi:hypothetical protein